MQKTYRGRFVFVRGSKNGRGGKIRTCDLTVPNRAHYQAVLRPGYLYVKEPFAKRNQNPNSIGENGIGQVSKKELDSRKAFILWAAAAR